MNEPHDHHDRHDHQAHGHDHHHGHERHGHEHDQGLSGMLRYLRIAPRMWSSSVNDAVVDLIAPRAGETVVDIGAGMGPGVIRAAASGANVIGVEPTPFMRRVVSTRRLLSKHRKCITIADGTAEALPLRTDEASAVWAVNTMHHWSDLARGAAEVARVLGPGGRTLLVDENFGDPQHPDSESWNERHEGDNHGMSMVDAEHIGHLLASGGLVDVVAEHRQIAGVPAITLTASAPW